MENERQDIESAGGSDSATSFGSAEEVAAGALLFEPKKAMLWWRLNNS